jgi:hypothetical protein
MSLEQTWHKMNAAEDADLNALLQPAQLPRFASKSPLVALKKKLLQGMILNGIIALCYIVIIITHPIWQVWLSLGIVLLFSAWVFYHSLQLYRAIEVSVSSSNPLLPELKRHYDAITRWTRIQERVGLFVHPVAAAGGFLLGGIWASGKSVTQLMSNPFMLTALAITCVVLIPAGYYTARWTNRYYFGKHLAALKTMIQELEQE